MGDVRDCPLVACMLTQMRLLHLEKWLQTMASMPNVPSETFLPCPALKKCSQPDTLNGICNLAVWS